jgi:DNA-binding transcriptional LysR family regulator
MLTVEHFTALPAIVRASDLAAVVPMAIGMLFPAQDFVLIDPDFPMDDYTVGMYWSPRFDSEPGHRWFRDVVSECLVTDALMSARKSPVSR